MKKNIFKATRAEHDWLMHSATFLLSALAYGCVIIKVISFIKLADDAATRILLLAPMAFLFSLSLGFCGTAAFHYIFRVILEQEKPEFATERKEIQ